MFAKICTNRCNIIFYFSDFFVRKILSLSSNFCKLDLYGWTDQGALHFMSWQLCWTWPITHIAVTTVEMHYPLPNWSHIHCLLFVNLQQMLMNVKGWIFFCTEFSESPPLLCHILLNCHSTAICKKLRKNSYCQEYLTSTALPPPTSNIVRQHNKIGDIMNAARRVVHHWQKFISNGNDCV